MRSMCAVGMQLGRSISTGQVIRRTSAMRGWTRKIRNTRSNMRALVTPMLLRRIGLGTAGQRIRVAPRFPRLFGHALFTGRRHR